MSNLHDYLWLIPALPLFAAVVIAFLGPRFLRGHSHWPCVLAVAASCVLSFFVLNAVRELTPYHQPHESLKEVRLEGDPAPVRESIEQYYTWARVGAVDLGLTLRADGLSAIMLV